ncbi:hypothetical protein [Robbsia andropogonis]|uniref:hypothetical protein n=1 Tax=Robbsia andropogonis TaxID=28092 RepID=UPI0012F92770|nr:hypothetical protein [Robbsia andropogonis]
MKVIGILLKVMRENAGAFRRNNQQQCVKIGDKRRHDAGEFQQKAVEVTSIAQDSEKFSQT